MVGRRFVAQTEKRAFPGSRGDRSRCARLIFSLFLTLTEGIQAGRVHPSQSYAGCCGATARSTHRPPLARASGRRGRLATPTTRRGRRGGEAADADAARGCARSPTNNVRAARAAGCPCRAPRKVCEYIICATCARQHAGFHARAHSERDCFTGRGSVASVRAQASRQRRANAPGAAMMARQRRSFS